MTNVYLHADAHGGHKNVHRFRNKFTSELEHFEYIAHQYNNTVRKNDLVYFLGDVAFTKERLEDIKKWSGRKILILGNHDTDKDVNIIDIVNSGTYEEIHSLKKYKSHFWLSHAPIHPDELRGRINVHGHCVDDTTEILTINGWKNRFDLSLDDVVYSYDKKSGLLVKANIDEIIDVNYTGDVYTFNTKSVNQRVTADHTMVGLIGRKSNIYAEFPAKDLIKRSKHTFIMNGIVDNTGVELQDDMLELLIAINADCSIPKNPNSVFRFMVHKQRKVDYFTNLLDRLGITYVIYIHKNEKVKSINFYIPDDLKGWGMKGLDDRLINCNQRQFEIILKAYYNTDGTKYDNYSTVYTSKRNECDLLSHLATINGYTSTTSIRDGHGYSKGISYEMYFRKCSTNITLKMKQNTDMEHVDSEHFWCIKTQHQNFFVRRNGKVSLTGNCHNHMITLPDGTIDNRYFNACIEHHDYNVVAMDTIKAHYGIK